MTLSKRQKYIAAIIALLSSFLLLFTNMSPAPIGFNEQCYLERYPDIAEKWVENGLLAADHYKLYGKSEELIPGCDGLEGFHAMGPQSEKTVQ